MSITSVSVISRRMVASRSHDLPAHHPCRVVSGTRSSSAASWREPRKAAHSFRQSEKRRWSCSQLWSRAISAIFGLRTVRVIAALDVNGQAARVIA